MTNQHIEIHDPFNGLNGSTDSTRKSVSDSEDTKDMVEFRILMAYATRRRPKETNGPEQDSPTTPNGNAVNGPPSTEQQPIKEEKKRKRKIWKRLAKGLNCLKPQTKEELPVPRDDYEENNERSATFGIGGAQIEDHLEDVAARLAEISCEIPFVPPEIETDTPDEETSDDVERVIGLLLREAGDRLNESELKGTNLADLLLGNYSFFDEVIMTLLTRMGLGSNTDTIGPTVSPKTQIAVTCEATSRLSVLDTLPVNRLMGHGARFLKTHFSSWVEEHGGYENAFDSDEEEVH